LEIRTVCESIITLLPNQDDEVEAELMVVVAPDVPHSLFLDETYIHRILMNLLSNALKFTSSGYILLLIEMKNGKLVASVTDTGCGVPPSFLPQLFEPFKQAQTRGRHRGTGLGLSIIKQLLHKMEGSIEVESRFQDSEDVGIERSGSVFTITVPVQLGTSPQPVHEPVRIRPKIAIFHGGNGRSLTGLTTAWEKFEFQVIIAWEFSDISGSDLKYIWADLPFLKQNSTLLHQLLDQDQYVVLVPYDMQSALHEVPELLQAPQHFIPLQKPLIWHSIKKRIAAACQPSSKLSPPRTVRFDPKVEVLEHAAVKEASPRQIPQGQPQGQPQVEEAATKKFVVLLVEDNPINTKLGKKMLHSLGYDVLTAEDGVEAIDQIVRHDHVIDIILMDQSMPRKDGLTTTREIRQMEAVGTLSRRRPIIAVTAVVSPQAQALCRLAGTDDFLAKPLSLGKLEQALATHLDLSR
jgi:CheY-like chemotaxis protein